jgi:hypothetical protein
MPVWKILTHALAALVVATALIGPGAAQQTGEASDSPAVAPDPRADDADYQRSRKLLSAIDGILRRAAEERAGAQDLPSRNEFLVRPLWTETREDREERLRALLDSVLEILSEAPVVSMQDEIARRRQSVTAIQDEIATLRELRLGAPEDGFLPGVLTQTKASIDTAIAEAEARIEANRAEIERLKRDIHAALVKSGINIAPEQLDLLLDSVLGSDLLKLVTAFEAATAIDKHLSELLTQSGENIKAARRYYAMHAALFAMLLHAQDTLIAKIDDVYLAKLQAILTDIRTTRQETYRLLAGDNRPDQIRALRANLQSQDFAEKVASFYRDYLNTQRAHLNASREGTIRDLRIADNTYQTVEASFQLRALMDEARSSIEAIQRLEAPGFDQIFRNESLRKEFEALTQKLAPSS